MTHINKIQLFRHFWVILLQVNRYLWDLGGVLEGHAVISHKWIKRAFHKNGGFRRLKRKVRMAYPYLSMIHFLILSINIGIIRFSDFTM
ncbi:hypothetical protein FB545_2102 [Peribacillus frigoritolerans]|nr:hypothetical protein FB545_2102 [Peribacillus frigoritolerans]